MIVDLPSSVTMDNGRVGGDDLSVITLEVLSNSRVAKLCTHYGRA